MTAEQQFLIDLVQAWASGRTTPLPLPPGVDAVAVCDRLRAHNVEAALGPLLPATAHTSAFTKQMNLSRGRTDFLLMECERLLPALSGSGWHPVLLKGTALALGTYAQATDRWFLDMDVLVPRPEVDAVCGRLEAAGYRYLQGARDPLFYEKYHLHRIMLGPQGAVLEVHWDLTLPGSVYSHDVAGVFARAGTCTLGHRQVRCAAPVDQILHGVYQNIADGFVDLRRVLDLVVLTPLLDTVDWDYLVAESQRTGMATALYLTLHIMKEISGVAAPLAVMTALDPGPATRRTLRGLAVVSGCLDRRASHYEGYTPMLHFLLTPGLRLRIREILRSVWVGEAMLMDRGHQAQKLPGVFQRTLIGIRQLRTLVLVSARVLKATVTG